jgi:hypothetical protein
MDSDLKQMLQCLRMAAMAAVMAVLALTGCTVKTTVQVTAATSANVTHLYVTVQEVWFASDSTLTPTDDGWVKDVLSTPVTVDLAALNDGLFSTLASIELGSTTYTQVRLVLADASATLTSSASSLGLPFNDAVQYVDTSGVSHVLPLEFATPQSSLLIPISIRLKSSSSSSSTTSAKLRATNGTVTLDVDALRGVVFFTYGDQTGALLSPEMSAYDEAHAGSIAGTFDVSAISSAALTDDQGIVVTAEALSSDGSRHVTVKSTRMNGSGGFTLSPVPVDGSTGTASYDLVVHGPGVETVIVTGVTVTRGATTTVQSSDVPLPSSTSFTVNTSNASVPGGTRVDFYQTLPSNAAPYLIESAVINPFSGSFTADLSLATQPVVLGAYNGGDVISFASVTPQEGTATYQIVTDSPWRAPSAFGTIVTGPSSGSSTAQIISPPKPNLPTGAVARSIAGTISFLTPGQFDSLYVLISRGGQLVDAVNLSSSLGDNASINFRASNIPGDTADSVYDVAIRAWNSSNAASSLVRAAFANQADLRHSDASGSDMQL